LKPATMLRISSDCEDISSVYQHTAGYSHPSIPLWSSQGFDTLNH